MTRLCSTVDWMDSYRPWAAHVFMSMSLLIGRLSGAKLQTHFVQVVWAPHRAVKVAPLLSVGLLLMGVGLSWVEYRGNCRLWS